MDRKSPDACQEIEKDSWAELETYAVGAAPEHAAWKQQAVAYLNQQGQQIPTEQHFWTNM